MRARSCAAAQTCRTAHPASTLPARAYRRAMESAVVVERTGDPGESPAPDAAALLSPRLSIGERVRLVSPASFPTAEWSRKHGTSSRTGTCRRHRPARHGSMGFMAGSDQDRLDDLNDAFRDPGGGGGHCHVGGAGAIESPRTSTLTRGPGMIPVAHTACRLSLSFCHVPSAPGCRQVFAALFCCSKTFAAWGWVGSIASSPADQRRRSVAKRGTRCGRRATLTVGFGVCPADGRPLSLAACCATQWFRCVSGRSLTDRKPVESPIIPATPAAGPRSSAPAHRPGHRPPATARSPPRSGHWPAHIVCPPAPFAPPSGWPSISAYRS